MITFFCSSVSKTEHLPESKVIKIAIIDTGADIDHEFIKDNLWLNMGEVGVDENGVDRSNNGIDDDLNGYTDDLYGWDFAKNTADVSDNDGHGTHIAGVIKSAIAKNASFSKYDFMILKYYDNKHSSLRSNHNTFLEALRYAINMGADIINISGGGHHRNTEELRVLTEAQEQGILVVAAAGNKNKRNKGNKAFYPAAYKLPNIISVVATDDNGHILRTSNLNVMKANRFAVGEKIYSSLPGNRFGFRTGSSQAAANITGYIASQMYLSQK